MHRCFHLLVGMTLALAASTPSRADAIAASRPGPATDSTAAGDTLTVADCVRLARRNAAQVGAAIHDERAAAAGLAAARLNRRPAYAFTAGAWVAPGRSYDPAVTDLGQYHALAGLELPLLDGGARARERERARAELAGASARRALAQREAGAEAAALAFRIARLDESLALLADHEAGLAGIGALVSAGVRSGARSPADSIRLALAVADAALARQSAAADRSEAALALLELLGRPLDGAIVPRAPVAPGGAPSAQDSSALVARAGARAEVEIARTDEAAARLDALDAERAGAPALGLAADAGFAGTDLAHVVPAALIEGDPGATFRDRLRRDFGVSVALDLRWPLFDTARRFGTEARTEAFRAAGSRRAAEEVAQRRAAIAAVGRARATSARLAIADDVVARAETHYLRTKSLYAAGATTLFDLLDAYAMDQDARSRRAEAREEDGMARFEIEERK